MQAQIKPVQVVKDTANYLFVSPKYDNTVGSAPVFNASLLEVTVTEGEDGKDPVETSRGLLSFQVPMTDKQWANWTTQPDEEYILACVAENYGVVLV